MDEKNNISLEQYGFNNDILSEYDITVLNALSMRKVLHLKTTVGDFVLKKSKLSAEELLFSFAALNHVKKKGIHVPSIIPTRSGELFIEKNGIKYFMMDLLKGREIQYAKKHDLCLATQNIAMFHQATHGFSPPYCPGKSQWGTWEGHFKERILEMREWKDLAENGGTLFDQIYAKQAEHWIEEALYAVDLLTNSRYQEISVLEKNLQGFCHHDLANHNILITDEDQIAMIDFDYTISDIRTHDLSSLILRNMKESQWDLEIALFILENYYEVVKPYKGEERLIHAMLRFPQDFYELGRFYYVEKRSNIEKLETRLYKWGEQQENRQIFFRQFEKSAGQILIQLLKE